MSDPTPPGRDSYAAIPAHQRHGSDGQYSPNTPGTSMPSYDAPFNFQTANSVLGLDQLIAYGASQQSMAMQGLSPSLTNSPYSPALATPFSINQSPPLSTPSHNSQYLASPSGNDNPPLFSSVAAGRPDLGWNQQSSPHHQPDDLNYPNPYMSRFTQSQPPKPVPSPDMPLGRHSPIPGTLEWLSFRVANLFPQQRAVVESEYTVWHEQPERQILVVDMLYSWFQDGIRPKNEDLLKFFRAQYEPDDQTSRGRFGKGGQGARGGPTGYICERPDCGKTLGGRTDRAHEHALHHLDIKEHACGAPCTSSFLRKNELNRHLKSCKIRNQNGLQTSPDANTLFLSIHPTAVASTSRPSSGQAASSRPARPPRALRGTSNEISPSTSGKESPVASRVTDLYPSFPSPALPHGHFQTQPRHQPQGAGFGGTGDSQMLYGPVPPPPPPPPQQHALNHTHLHTPHHHNGNNGNHNSHVQAMMGMNGGGMPSLQTYGDQHGSARCSRGPVLDDENLFKARADPPKQFSPALHTLRPQGSPQMPIYYDGPQLPLHSSPVQRGLVVLSQTTPPLPQNELAASSSQRLSVSSSHPYPYGQTFYHPPPYPPNASASGYAYYADQQPPSQSR